MKTNQLPETLFLQFRRHENMMRREMVLRRKKKIPRGQGFILSQLAEHDGVTQRELAVLSHIQPSSLSELLGKMEGYGLVEKVQNKKDRRVTNLHLTEKGYLSAADAAAFRKTVSALQYACLTETEQQTLSDLLRKVMDAMEVRIEALEKDHAE